MASVQTDVIVVGAGNAGLVAALAAHEAGARVVVLESADRKERGGNSYFSGGIFRTAHAGLPSLEPLLGNERSPWHERLRVAPYTPDHFLADWLTVTSGRANLDLIKTVVDRSSETLTWMHDHGVAFELVGDKLFDPAKLAPGAIYDIPPGGAIRAKHEGVGLVHNLFAAVEQAGINVWYEAPAATLLASGATVEGVRIRRRDRFDELYGTVVLAAGGFESNPEMRLRYLGSGWDLVKVRGTGFNMGTMLVQALQSGAQPAGHWEGCHAAPIDAAAPPVGDRRMTDKYSRYSYPYSLMVNSRGERFVDEGEDQVWLTYAKTGWAVRAQPTGIAWQIFDQKTVHLLEPRYSTASPVEAGTIPALAEQLGIPAPALERTVQSFNLAVAEDAGARFNPFTNDGLVASPEGQPPKSNWAQRLDTPPFVAYAVACGITFTYGGLKVDTGARVLDTEGRPMPGLYATGEIIGDFFYFNYGAGTGLMRGAVFGRIAGENAASESRVRAGAAATPV
ncbi:MAG: FAD-dependent tricarballylate dehydrogenase TcuA [Chloroflexi bacterium]|nr:FAD-dependent tricarballylate dehydrogenase TcuA [Chloroflexota bacterium]